MSLPRIACWLDYWVWAGAVWILLNNWLRRTYLRNLHPRVTFHGVNVVSAFPWKQNRKMFAARSDNVSLLIEHSTIFVSTEIFLRCASKRGVTLGQMSLTQFSMESFRKAAYRQFALWKYGKLGRGNRRVLPACAVRLIRQAYPSADGRYMGFRNN